MTTPATTLTASQTAVRQKGAVLVVGLLILLVMTVLGVAAMSSTTLQERMANNNRQQQVAFQATEVALRAAETYLSNSISSVTALNTNFNSAAPVAGLYDFILIDCPPSINMLTVHVSVARRLQYL